MIIDGRAIASSILAAVRADIASRKHAPVICAIAMRPSAATRSYLATKSTRAEEAGMKLKVIEVPEYGSTEDVLSAVAGAKGDAILVQLPLPERIDRARVLDNIPLEKDADILSRAAYERFDSEQAGALLPPVAAAVREILRTAHIDPKGKHVAVVGNGSLVGRPSAVWFMQQGARVTVVTREKAEDLASVLAGADIVVSGAGSPGLIQKGMLKKGVVLIDAGTSESGGQMVGDMDPSCADVASLFTPVPGGVGPIAVAMLFKNVAKLLDRA
jgi:methylenetetrahydrofolate dehydrogenase (NADP+)/methenyltetrahydrofolate cyclohydrolase